MNARRTAMQRGFALLEAVIAMAIVAFGLLVLAGVNLKLAHSEDVAKQRGEATRLAQERIEQMRGYTRIATTAGTLAWSDLTDGSDTITASAEYATNTTFTRTWSLTGAVGDWRQPPFDWAGSCAPCHATGFESLKPAWKALAITCEACHGKSDEHVKKAGRGKEKAPGVEVGYTKKSSTPIEDRNRACLACHQGANRISWQSSVHATRDVACTSCHQIHAQNDKVRDRQAQSEVCILDGNADSCRPRLGIDTRVDILHHASVAAPGICGSGDAGASPRSHN